MIALGLALRARLGEADDDAMRWATVAVLETFEPGDPLVLAVRAMGRDWTVLRLPDNAPLLQDAGERLWRAIIRSSWPGPSPRPDIGG